MELSQYTSGTVCAGDKNQAILSVNVKTTDDLNALSAEKFAFTTNSTFAQVEKATLYYTGKNNSFTTSHKVGEANITADDFEISCSAPQVLFEGNNYFWLAYDLKADATNGQTMDAGCTAVTVSGAAHPVATPQPEGNRTVKNEYISTVGRFEKTVSGSWSFTHTPQSQYNPKYKAEKGDQIVTFVPATNGKVMEINFADFEVVYAANTYQTRAKFQIFSGKTISGEKLWEVNANNKSTGPGKTIRSKSADGALTILFNANTTSNYQTGKGWHATVSEYLPQPMQFTGSSAFQTNTNIVKPGALNQEIIGIEILTTGDQSPLTLNELVLNLKGSQDKIKKVSVFSTGDNKAFDTKTLLGEALAPASSSLSITPTAPLALAEGKNYFWVAYDMKDVLASDQVIDAALESLKIDNELKTPTVGDPDGLRIIKNIYEFENGTHTVQVASSLMFYDNGGPDGPYTAAAKGTVTFVPQPGKVIKMVFKSFQTTNGHKFYVHNGGVDGPQIAELKGNLNSRLPAPILSTADDGSLTVKFAPSSVSTSPDGWEIEVISYTPQPLSISSVNATAVSADKLLRGAKDEQMLKIKVEVTGDKGSINLNTFSFDTEGTAAADIAAATLYHSGTEDAFSTASPYAAALTQAPFTFNGSTAITKAGVYVFWLTYDVASTAATGNVLKAKLTTAKQAETPLTITENAVAGRSVQDGFKGTYSIGTSNGANYNTFAAAIAAMQQGIDGKVVFEVEDGTYSQLVKIPHIPGASAENTITFKSKSNDYNKVTIEVNTAPGTNGDKPGIFTVDGADYLNIEGFSIKTNKAKYPAVVLVRNVSNHVTVKNCMIQAPRSTSYSSGNIALVRVEGLSEPYRNCDYFRLENSKLDGGYTGAYIYGTANVSLPKQKGARIAGNEFTNQGNMAVYLTKEHDGIVENNRIRVSGTTTSTFKGIDAVMMGNTIIRGNRIYADNTTSGAVNGLYLRRRDSEETLAGRNRVYNNEIIIDNAKGSPLYGIFFADGLTNTDIAYNSVNIVKSTAVQQSAPILIDIKKANEPNMSVTVENNLFQNNAGGYVYRVNSAAAFAGVSFSNNGLYTSGSTFAYGGAAIDAFDAWQTASGETNSLVEQAQFLSATSLSLKAKGNLQKAKPLDFVTNDIDKKTRGAAPTIGAYEYEDLVAVKPEMIAGYPKKGNVTYNSLQVISKWSQTGKLYTVLLKKNAPAASEQDLLAETAVELSKNQDYTSLFEGIDAEEEYRVYFLFVTALGAKSDILTSEVIRTPKYIFPLDVKLPEKWATVAAGVTEKIFPVVKGGIYPYTYEWYNKMNEKISTDSVLNVSADRSQQYHLTVKTADKQSLTLYTDLVVTGKSYAATFEDNYLAPESYWWKKETEDMESIFYSGSYSFTNTYIKEWKSWGGFAYSNETATDFDPANLLTHQFRSVTGKGAQDSKTFAVVYTLGSKTEIGISNNSEGEIVPGVFITNAAYTYHSMTKGDTFAGDPFKKGDFLKIIFTGKTASNSNSTLEYYLADYRSTNEAEHYMLTDWKWIDLSPLGKVKSITIRMDGSRKGDYGLNTPAYFCMDNLGATRPEGTSIESISLLSVHPNPFKDHLRVYANREAVASITDLSGRVLMNFSLYPGENQIDTSSLPAGFYLLRSGSQSVKLMK